MKPNKVMKYLLGYSFGIYLAHMAFIGGFEIMVDKLGLELAPYSALEKLPITIMISAYCIMFIVVVRKIRLARLLLLGEASPRPQPARDVARERSVEPLQTRKRVCRSSRGVGIAPRNYSWRPSVCRLGLDPLWFGRQGELGLEPETPC